MAGECYAIIAAGGTGTRMGGDIPKQFIKINGKPLIAYTIEKFEQCKKVDKIIIVSAKSFESYCGGLAEQFCFKKIYGIVSGGSDRLHSVYEGLRQIPPDAKYVLVHDAARPFVTAGEITGVIEKISRSGCAVLASPVKDTIKETNGSLEIINTLDRSALYNAQTPQGFYYEVIVKAYENAIKNNTAASDDSQLAENIGIKPVIVEGSYLNFKITTEEDLFLAKLIINSTAINHNKIIIK